MNITDRETKKIRELFSEFLGGKVMAKHLFIGYGIYYDNIMFGIYKNNVFYLKAEDELSEILEKHGAISWKTLIPNAKLSISKYYHLPSTITNNKVLYQKLVLSSIHQIRLKQIEQALEKLNRIKELPNLTIKHERLLSKIGVFTVQEFKLQGPFTCYAKLKQLGFSLNIEFFWSLFASLQYKHVSLLTESERKQAFLRLNETLAEFGLRKIKSDRYE
ncbi:TfoX/Sxy family DNA transformation protein [Pasteurellaceae bacterium LIM206]|nr:TfoX/Sxy family DNA transformation protein [Pasteurellaceae bacterium LIM206]